MSNIIVSWQVYTEQNGHLECLSSWNTRAEADAELRREKSFYPDVFLAELTWEQVTEPAPRLSLV